MKGGVSLSSRRRASLMELMIGVAIIGIAIMPFSGSIINGPRSVFSRYDVSGIVTAEPGIKIKTGEGAESKYAINLDTTSGPKIVNCTSTQCSTLQIGQRVSLSCYEELHLSEPNEEECRFDKLLPAASK